MADRDLSAFFDEGLTYTAVPSKAFPAPEGKAYRVSSPDAKTGLWLNATAQFGQMAATGAKLTESALARLRLDDDEERDFYQRVLGAAFDEMIDDGVDWMLLQKIGQDAYLNFAMSEQAADAALERLGKAQPRPNRATRRTTQRKAGSKSSRASTGTQARTRGRASTPSSKPESAEQA